MTVQSEGHKLTQISSLTLCVCRALFFKSTLLNFAVPFVDTKCSVCLHIFHTLGKSCLTRHHTQHLLYRTLDLYVPWAHLISVLVITLNFKTSVTDRIRHVMKTDSCIPFSPTIAARPTYSLLLIRKKSKVSQALYTISHYPCKR